MIPTPDNRERLLAETFHGDWSSGNAARFATRAAAHARRRRTRLRAAQATATAALLIALVTTLSRPTSAPRNIAPPSPTSRAAYEIISDTELLSLVQDRPLLLVQNAGAPPQIFTFEQ